MAEGNRLFIGKEGKFDTPTPKGMGFYTTSGEAVLSNDTHCYWSNFKCQFCPNCLVDRHSVASKNRKVKGHPIHPTAKAIGFLGYFHNIPHGTVVRLIKCWSRRKCLIEWENGQDISMVSLLRKIKEAS